MTTRFFPRNSQSRNDGLVGPGHVFGHDPRNEQSRRDGYVSDLGAQGNNKFVNGTVAVTGGNSLGVKSIVAGGSALLFTLTSSQDAWQFPDSGNILPAWAAGLSAGFNAASLAAALATSQFSVDITGLKMNIVLPAIAAYSPGIGTAFLWTIPREAFRNANVGVAVASAIVVTSA